MAIKKRRGAPTKPAKSRKQEHITVWLTQEDKDLVSSVAAEDGDAAGAWARKVVVRIARDRRGIGGGD